MIPANVDIDSLARQLEQGSIAWQSSKSPQREDAPYIESALHGTNIKLVVLDETPAQTADLRDIAQTLMEKTGSETVVVRAPGSGALVSTHYSRANLEYGQAAFLADGDYTHATQQLVSTLTSHNSTPSSVEFLGGGVIGIVLVMLLTFFSLKSRKKGR
ncbi:MAG: hypothetical protein Q3962_01475 [Corynebacterium sp.]|nr:hypothetical protein [Corynebacterium sp.]